MKATDLAAGAARWLAADLGRDSVATIGAAPDHAQPEIAGTDVAAARYVRSPAGPTGPGFDKPVENGSGDLATTVAPSGNAVVDALFSGVAWADGSITFGFPTLAVQYGPSYSDPGSLTGFAPFTADQRAAVRFALDTAGAGTAAGFSVEGFTGLNIGFDAIGGNATLRFANSSAPESAYAYYPSSTDVGGDSFYGGAGVDPVAGTYDWHAVLHETGHALGLKHGHETDVNGALPAALDSLEFSVMTYRTYIGADPGSYKYFFEDSGPQTFMMYDIAALQYMYGADYTTNSGNTTYKWNPTDGDTVVEGVKAIDAAGGVIFLTVWDGGGVDTYDLTSYTTDLDVDLRPGASSIFDPLQLANLDVELRPGASSIFDPLQLANLSDGPNAGFARGSVFNALRFGNSNASLIENIEAGSGNDRLVGNDVANVMHGNGGNDYFLGYAGDDTFEGGSGEDDGNAGSGNDTALLGADDDRMYGWNGDDNLSGEAGLDRLIGDAGVDTLDGGTENDRLYGGSGNDILLGGDGADFIDGSGGDDDITGGAGADRLQGRVGADNFFFAGGSGADRIFGFEDDIDTLFIDGSDYGYATAADVVADASVSGGNLFIDFGGGNSLNLWLFVTNGGTAGDLLDDIVIV